MSRVLFRVTYTIADGKRAEYLRLIEQITAFYNGSDVSFSLFEDRAQHNRFHEVYLYPSAEAYEASDDPDSTKDIADVIDQVYSMATQVKYEVADEAQP
jgi:hypothetical protein